MSRRPSQLTNSKSKQTKTTRGSEEQRSSAQRISSRQKSNFPKTTGTGSTRTTGTTSARSINHSPPRTSSGTVKDSGISAAEELSSSSNSLCDEQSNRNQSEPDQDQVLTNPEQQAFLNRPRRGQDVVDLEDKDNTKWEFESFGNLQITGVILSW